MKLMMLFIISTHCCVLMFTVSMHTTIAHIAIIRPLTVHRVAAAFLCAENYPNYVAMSHCLLSLKSGRSQYIVLRPLFYVLKIIQTTSQCHIAYSH